MFNSLTWEATGGHYPNLYCQLLKTQGMPGLVEV